MREKLRERDRRGRGEKERGCFAPCPTRPKQRLIGREVLVWGKGKKKG
jgi:hypothetical protein